MTPDERDRLTRMEGNVQHLAAADARLEKRMEEMDGKLDQILMAAAMGKGAWWMILKVGGVLSLIAGVGVWIWDRIYPHG